MNELFSNEPNELKFYCRVKTSLIDPEEMPVARLIVGEVIKELPVRRVTQGVYAVPVNNTDIQTKNASVEFSYSLPDYGDIVDSQSFEIARRLVSYDEMQQVLTPELTYENYSEVERTVRGVIEAHCRQSFNYWYGTNTAVGNDGIIMLPQHLDRLEYVEKKLSAINSYHISFSDDGYEVTADGMAIQNIECLEQQKYMQAKARQSDYLIRGQWGYKSVPTPVKQAAALIVQNKLCPSGSWHENYIDNLRSDNMRVQFNPSSYDDSTGVYDADQLLSMYRNMTLGAI